MTCTMDEIVAAAKHRGYRTKYKIDSKNNSQYGIITKDGNSLELRYVEPERAGGVRTHVGSLMKDFRVRRMNFSTGMKNSSQTETETARSATMSKKNSQKKNRFHIGIIHNEERKDC